MSEYVILALDIGASNGRGVLGYYNPEGKLLRTEEVHRFFHRYVTIAGTVCWDYITIYNNIIECLRLCKKRGVELDCIGIDTWGQDYAYIGKHGQLMGAPRCYRDPINETHGSALEMRLGLDHKQLYERSGVTTGNISTVRQLEHDSRELPELFDNAAYWVNMPYLFVYLLSGIVGSDITLLSLGGLLDHTKKQISIETVEALGCADKIPTVFPCGTIMAHTGREVLESTGYDRVPIACVNGHDTSSAVSAIPQRDEFLWISSGTYGMLGAVAEDFSISDSSYHMRINSTPLGDGRTCLMQGAAGMYYFQQCMNFWQDHGEDITYEELTEYALSHENDVWFKFDTIPSMTTDMPVQLQAACKRNGFEPPQSSKELYVAFANSLAKLTAKKLMALEDILGKRFDKIYVMGGGSKADGVNIRIARECDRELFTGLTEASSIGNMLAQLVAVGAVTWQETAEISECSFPLRRFGV